MNRVGGGVLWLFKQSNEAGFNPLFFIMNLMKSKDGNGQGEYYTFKNMATEPKEIDY